MKARIRATGDIYNVIDMNDYRNRFKLEDYNWYTMGEIELIEGNEPDWQHYRIQFVGQIASAIISNYEFYAEGIAEECKRSGKSRPETVAQMSIEIADALVAEMKCSDDVYAECRRMDAINTASVCENMAKLQNELQKKGGQNETAK